MAYYRSVTKAVEEEKCTACGVVEKWYTTGDKNRGGEIVTRGLGTRQSYTRPTLTDLVHTIHDLELSPAVHHATAKL